MCLHTQTTKFKLRAQKCSFYIYNSMYSMYCSDSLFVSSGHIAFDEENLPSKHFETQTIEQLKIPTQKCCINFIIKCFYKLKIQIQTQSSKMLFLHLQFNVFTTVLTHYLCRQDISFLTK